MSALKLHIKSLNLFKTFLWNWMYMSTNIHFYPVTITVKISFKNYHNHVQQTVIKGTSSKSHLLWNKNFTHKKSWIMSNNLIERYKMLSQISTLHSFTIIVHTPTPRQIRNICQHRNSNYSDIKLFLWYIVIFAFSVSLSQDIIFAPLFLSSRVVQLNLLTFQ